jgi:hypothetical protein
MDSVRLKNKLFAELLKFRGNELVTVRISAFCGAILSNNSTTKVVFFVEFPKNK